MAGEEFVLISTCGKNVQMLAKVKLEGYYSDEAEETENDFKFREIFFSKRKAVRKNKPEVYRYLIQI